VIGDIPRSEAYATGAYPFPMPPSWRTSFQGKLKIDTEEELPFFRKPRQAIFWQPSTARASWSSPLHLACNCVLDRTRNEVRWKVQRRRGTSRWAAISRQALVRLKPSSRERRAPGHRQAGPSPARSATAALRRTTPAQTSSGTLRGRVPSAPLRHGSCSRRPRLAILVALLTNLTTFLRFKDRASPWRTPKIILTIQEQ